MGYLNLPPPLCCVPKLLPPFSRVQRCDWLFHLQQVNTASPKGEGLAEFENKIRI